MSFIKIIKLKAKAGSGGVVNPPAEGNVVHHIIAYGQSLGEGWNSNPVLTTAPFSERALMFNHGLRTRKGVAPKYQSFVPHVERSDTEGTTTLGETPLAGCIQQLLAENVTDSVFLSSCDALGGQSVAQLSKGSVSYNNILADVTNGKLLAEASGKTYQLTAITYTQGEDDYGLGYEIYKTNLIKLRNDLVADIGAILGYSVANLPFVIYQAATSAFGNKTIDVPLVHLELATTAGTGFYMSTPMYHFPYADVYHLTNIGSKWYGHYQGQAIAEIMRGQPMSPLYPISHTVEGNDILLKFSKSNLVFEKASNITANAVNKGFNVKNGSAVEIITQVLMESTDTVRIKCSENPVGLNLTYGFQSLNTKNAGELRDSATKTALVNSLTLNMYNWCVIFKRII